MHGVITGLKVRNLLKNEKERQLDFSPRLYLGEGIKRSKLRRIKRKLIHEPFLADVMLLILPENGSDQLEIISSRYLFQNYYSDHTLRVAGIASSREDAFSLVMKITEDCLSSRRDCSLKEFLVWQ